MIHLHRSTVNTTGMHSRMGSRMLTLLRRVDQSGQNDRTRARSLWLILNCTVTLDIVNDFKMGLHIPFYKIASFPGLQSQLIQWKAW